MSSRFDHTPDRRKSDSKKWRRYDGDVLPLWIADMEFRAPEAVIRALHERVEHGVFGYFSEPPELREIVVERLGAYHGWSVAPEALVFVPGVGTGFNLAARAVTSDGDGILMQTPIYYPILRVPGNAGCTCDEMELVRLADGSYAIDWDAFEAAISRRTRIFILVNPHNPVGRVFRRDELERMAEICLRHDIVICSDEIHCDLVYSEHRHLSIASLDPKVEDQSITLIAPSKTYNIPGLFFSVAIIPNPELRERFEAAGRDLVPDVNVLGYVAGMAAYQHGQSWLDELLDYLEANREALYEYVAGQLPGIQMARPEGTYLAWLDCRDAGLPGSPHEFFLREARVALNDGATFGRGGEGFVRLNYGCSRTMLMEALERMRAALGRLR
jgi:cystathionine beta-lyase